MKSQQADDGISESEITRYFALAAQAMRAEIACRLLAGNDTGCFSTEQYRQAYESRYPIAGVTSEQLWAYITPDSHLRSIPQAVREVAPGIWAAAN